MRYFYKNNPNRIIDTDREGGQPSEDWFWSNIGWFAFLLIFVLCCIAGLIYGFTWKQTATHFVVIAVAFYGGVLLWVDK